MIRLILTSMPNELILSAANRVVSAYTKSGGDDKNAACKELVGKLKASMSNAHVYMSQRVTTINLRKEDTARVEAARQLINALRAGKFSPEDKTVAATQTVIDITSIDNLKMGVFCRGYVRKGAVIDSILAGFDSESLATALETLPEVQALAEQLRTAQNAFMDAQYKKVAVLNANKEQKRRHALVCAELINDIARVAKAMQPDSDFAIQVKDTIKWAKSEYKAGIKHKEGGSSSDDGGKDSGSDSGNGSENGSGSDGNSDSGSNPDSGSGSDSDKGSESGSDKGSDGGSDSDGGGNDDDGDDTVDK